MASTSVTTKTVVVADDTAFVRDRFRTALENAGHKAIAVKSAAELLARVRADLDQHRSDRARPAAAARARASTWCASIRKLDDGRLPILVFSGTIASADEVRELAALGVAGYVNEYSAVQHILPSLAPHLFPDNFNRRGSPRVVLGIPIQYRFGNTIAAALTLNLSHGGIAIRTTSPLDSGAQDQGPLPHARVASATSTPKAASPGATAASAWASSSRRSIRPTRRSSTTSSTRTSSATGKREPLHRLAWHPVSRAMERADADTVACVVGAAGVLALVFANGFFVAAEFAIVTVRKTRIDQLIAEGHRGARAVRRAVTDPDSYIAATQLGITMASLGLGWIGEPALAALIQPAFAVAAGARSPRRPRTASPSPIAFAIVTALHIVLGELAPKTIALERAEATALLVVKPTELFMRVFWPFIRLLNGTGRAVVRAARPARAAAATRWCTPKKS